MSSPESTRSDARSFDPSTAGIAGEPRTSTQTDEPPATDPRGSGVTTLGPSVPGPAPMRRGVTVTGVLGVMGLLLACLGLLGQGERCVVDARFRSPDATLRTYWEALRRGDAELVWACYTEGRTDLPVPGQLWFLPPTERLEIAGVRTLPVEPNRVMVTYEVQYVPRGLSELRSFRTGDELVRVRGEWRISRPIGEVSMPDPEPIPRPVDS